MSHPWPLYTNCFGQNFTRDTDRNGMACIIVGELTERTSMLGHDVYRAPGYRVLWDDGTEALVRPENLRRRQQRKPDRRGFVATGLKKILELFKERETSKETL